MTSAYIWEPRRETPMRRKLDNDKQTKSTRNTRATRKLDQVSARWRLRSSKSVGKKQAKSFDGPKWSSLAQAKNYGKDRLYDRKLRTGWTHWPASMTLLTRKRRTWGTSGQPTESWSKLLMHFREKRECKPKSKLNCNVLITFISFFSKRWMN